MYNRVDTARKLLDSISSMKLKNVNFILDGPKDEFDKLKTDEVLLIVKKYKPYCNLNVIVNKNNLGLKKNISLNLTRLLKEYKKAVILEDDCIPVKSFFVYCEHLLDKYESSNKIYTINGSNFQKNKNSGNESYYFSKYPHCWGWATWQRAWEKYDPEISFWDEYKLSAKWLGIHNNAKERRGWEGIFDKVHRGLINSWAYPWTATVWFNEGISVTPTINLVDNIGFDSFATNTKTPMINYSKKARDFVDFIEPKEIQVNVKYDKYTYDGLFQGKYQRYPLKIIALIKAVIRKLIIFNE